MDNTFIHYSDDNFGRQMLRYALHRAAVPGTRMSGSAGTCSEDRAGSKSAECNEDTTGEAHTKCRTREWEAWARIDLRQLCLAN